MLVLSRQRDETIMIGDDVEITVVDIRGDKVRLGITAPRHIQVHRKEVYDAIKRENKAAAKISPRDVADVVERDAEQDKPGKESSGADRNQPLKGTAEDKRSDNPRPPSRTGRSR
jgi:carbon storage regulator